MAFKRSPPAYRDPGVNGKMPSQVYTHPAFIFTANNESCWELHTEQKSSTERWGLESPICSRGVATDCMSVTVTQAGSFTHNLLFPPAGESLSLTSDLFFTWFTPLGFAQCLSHGHKEILHSCLLRMALRYLVGNGKYQTFARSFGYHTPHTDTNFWERSCSFCGR